MKWICLEPHTHTNHSDAKYSVSDLLNAAHKARLDAIVLTDHNTNTGMDEIPSEQKEPRVVPGIEWTTFYGHVVIIAPEKFVEWRDLNTDNLDSHLRAVHEANGLVQMAHPFCPGEPFCCGCHWNFQIPDWQQIDIIEVWSEGDPDLTSWNAKAYSLWKNKWKEGFRPMAISARDWHDDADSKTVFGVNYLYIDETLPFTDAVKDAMRKKRAYMTAGPTLSFSAKTESRSYGIGDTIPTEKIDLSILIRARERTEVWEPYELQPEEIVLINNDEEMVFPFQGYDVPLEITKTFHSGFLYLELRGTAHKKPVKILMTNPISIQSSNL